MDRRERVCGGYLKTKVEISQEEEMRRGVYRGGPFRVWGDRGEQERADDVPIVGEPVCKLFFERSEMRADEAKRREQVNSS